MRVMPPVRSVKVHYGDTLQRLALRETGDASTWVDIALINDLLPPYLVEPGHGGPHLAEYGSTIKVPSSGSTVAAGPSLDALFGSDISLANGWIEDDGNGDVLLASGADNLGQALGRRVTVEKRELAFHPEYGCWVKSLRGMNGGPSTNSLAAFYVRSSLLEDNRVKQVVSCSAMQSGDAITVSAVVKAIDGSLVQVEATA